MRLDRDALLKQLRARHVDLQAFATDPAAFERACRMIYKSIPLPWRWIVRKKRVRYVAGLARDAYLHTAGTATLVEQVRTDASKDEPVQRLEGLAGTAAKTEDRMRIENERMMTVYQPALGESLDAIRDGQTIKFDGFAHVGNCESYYLITLEGIHYCDQEKTGLAKKRYAPRFFSLDPVESLDVESRGSNTYVRFMGGGKMLLTMWFQDELSAFRNMSAEDEAMRFASAYGA